MKKLLLIESPRGESRAVKIVEAGYEVEVVSEAATVWDALERFNPNLVVLDCELTGLSATQFMAQLREQPETKFLPVIALTRAKDDVSAQMVRMAGANQVFDKWKLKEPALLNAIRKNIPSWAFQPPKAPSPVAPSVPEPAPKLSSSDTKQIARLPGMANLKEGALELLKAEQTAARLKLVQEMNRELEKVIAGAAFPKSGLTAAILHALQALLRSLAEKPQFISATNMRTIYQTVYLLTPLPALKRERCHAQTSSLHILSVDDDELIRELLAETLALTGLQIQTAADPAIALDFARRKPWDLFILDVTMPIMDGYELCAKLRKFRNHAQTPVLFLTGNNDMDHRVRFAQTGADDFLAKPFQPQELTVKALGHLLIAQMRLEQL